MLVFTKLLIIFGIILLIIGVGVFYMGYKFSGNTTLNYYYTGSSQNNASQNFVQNGNTTIKFFGIFMIVIGVIMFIVAAINQSLRLSEKYHHLKYSKPLH